MGPVSAWLAFETRPLYPTYLHSLRLYGLTPLEDQRLGALIMVLMSTVAYGIAGLAAFIRLAETENAVPLIVHHVTDGAETERATGQNAPIAISADVGSWVDSLSAPTKSGISHGEVRCIGQARSRA